MDKDIIIRKVKPEDAVMWTDLGNKVWRIAYKDIFPEEVFIANEARKPKRIESFSRFIKNDDGNIAYVAEYEGKVIALMNGKIKSEYEHFEDCADLEALYIDSEFQGKGIGTKLKDIFFNWAKENGATKVVIGVLKDNNKARKVYEAWGGNLSSFENDFVRLGVPYPEVFYTYDI